MHNELSLIDIIIISARHRLHCLSLQVLRGHLNFIIAVLNGIDCLIIWLHLYLGL